LYEAKFGKRDLFWRLMGRLERASFAAADVSLATNESYARIARERGGMAAEDVFVVRSGPDVGRLRPSAPNPDWRKGRDHLIGYVGVMGDQEGLDLLLESARILCLEQGRSVQFALVGGGPALEGLQAQAEAMGLADHVTFAGRAPDTELFEVLSTADVCVNPDRVNPMNDLSTMNKIMEYMAFERPIVQFEVTEGRVSAGEASLYAAPNDPADMAAKLAQLLEDAPARARMGAFGRRRVVEELGWERQIEPLIAAYLRAAEKSAAAGSGAGTGGAPAGRSAPGRGLCAGDGARRGVRPRCGACAQAVDRRAGGGGGGLRLRRAADSVEPGQFGPEDPGRAAGSAPALAAHVARGGGGAALRAVDARRADGAAGPARGLRAVPALSDAPGRGAGAGGGGAAAALGLSPGGACQQERGADDPGGGGGGAGGSGPAAG
ncbi:MAG: glycosyltransferase family 4 protein, partial [Pseudomonadota bacterium]